MTILRGGFATARWIGSIMHCTLNAARRWNERLTLTRQWWRLLFHDLTVSSPIAKELTFVPPHVG
jgi:hypothetical protein